MAVTLGEERIAMTCLGKRTGEPGAVNPRNLEKRRRRRKSQGGQEIIEFGLVAVLFVPLLLGTFVTGMNLIKTVQAKVTVRDLANMYIHGADFSSYNYQQLAQRVATGLNLQFPAFSGNSNSNLGAAGDGMIWISQVMYVGTTSEPQCLSVPSGSCANANKFVFLQRIRFGKDLTSKRNSFLGDPTGATLSNTGAVSNPVTDTNAQLDSGPQAAMQALWQTTSGGRTPLGDGQVLYVVEGYFDTSSLSLGSFSSNGVYARYFF
jgi:hypothetical protein